MKIYHQYPMAAIIISPIDPINSHSIEFKDVNMEIDGITPNLEITDRNEDDVVVVSRRCFARAIFSGLAKCGPALRHRVQ